MKTSCWKDGYLRSIGGFEYIKPSPDGDIVAELFAYALQLNDVVGHHPVVGHWHVVRHGAHLFVDDMFENLSPRFAMRKL
jgi:hypothetical protein